MTKNNSSRRKFLQQLGGTSLLLSAGQLSSLAAEEAIEKRIIRYEKKITASDKINVAVIGMGLMDRRKQTKSLALEIIPLRSSGNMIRGLEGDGT